MEDNTQIDWPVSSLVNPSGAQARFLDLVPGEEGGREVISSGFFKYHLKMCLKFSGDKSEKGNIHRGWRVCNKLDGEVTSQR